MRRIYRPFPCVLLFLVAIITLNGILVARAQSGLEVRTDAAELDFPDRLIFTLSASSPGEVSEVYLEYGTNGRNCVEGVARQEAKLSLGDPFKATWVWDFKDSGSLPPGAEVWWQWQVRLRSGELLFTERRTLVIEDPHLDWSRLDSVQVVVVWSAGSRSFAQRILDLATASLDRLGKEAGIRPDGKVRLTVYPSFEALRQAGLFLPEWTGGVAFPQYSVVMLGIPVDSGNWMEEVVPHELAHLVTGERVFNCLGNDMPTWLSEGLSVYAEAAMDAVDEQQVRNALEVGKLPPLRNLSAGFSADPGEALLSYAQSGEIVRYMIKTHGPENMSALLSAIQSGQSINPALLEVYGLDTDGLDSAWRSSMGFEGLPRVSGTAAPNATRTAVPTQPLWTPAFGHVSPTATATETNTVSPVTLMTIGTATQTSVPQNSLDEFAEPMLTSTPLAGGAPGRFPCLGGVSLIAALILAYLLPKYGRQF